ncbi:MAG: ankyrin repeat domain-containing protein [Wolbachia sp.]
MDLLKAIRNARKKGIEELKNFLNENTEIVINREVFKSVLPKEFNNVRKEIVYLILHHCIKHDSAKSEKGDVLSFQSVMDILNEATRRFITPEYFHELINFQDQNGNTLLHQAVRDNNIEAIKALLKYGADPLIKNKEGKIPLALNQSEETRKALIEGMKGQVESKKESARCSSLIGIVPGVFLGVGIGVGSVLAGSSMAIMLGAIAVSTLVAGIAVGLLIYFSSQDREQAKAIEKVMNSETPSVNEVSSVFTDGEKVPAGNGTVLGLQQP